MAQVRKLLAEGYEAPVPKDAMRINTPLYVVWVHCSVKCTIDSGAVFRQRRMAT